MGFTEYLGGHFSAPCDRDDSRIGNVIPQYSPKAYQLAEKRHCLRVALPSDPWKPQLNGEMLKRVADYRAH